MCAAKERVVGWYSTGPKIREADLEINELFRKFCSNPVLCIIDVRPKDIGIPTEAYITVEEVKEVKQSSWICDLHGRVEKPGLTRLLCRMAPHQPARLLICHLKSAPSRS